MGISKVRYMGRVSSCQYSLYKSTAPKFTRSCIHLSILPLLMVENWSSALIRTSFSFSREMSYYMYTVPLLNVWFSLQWGHFKLPCGQLLPFVLLKAQTEIDYKNIMWLLSCELESHHKKCSDGDVSVSLPFNELL